MSVFEILDGATFKEDHQDICMRQDLDSKLRDLYAEQAKLHVAGDDADDQRLAGRGRDPRLDEIEEEIRGLEAGMEASVLTFWMRGVAPAEYAMLQRNSGKPRREQKMDQMLGYNVQNFFELAIKRCTYKVTSRDGHEAQFAEEHWRKLFSSINDATFDDLCGCVDRVNRRVAKSPSGARSSGSQNGSAQNPTPHTNLESLTSALLDGNQDESQQ
jgi:hypothetical protein